jgi:uncharacterized repeat protein (TIGR02543 family)
LIVALLCGGVFETFAAEAGAASRDEPDFGIEALEAVTSEPKAGSEYDGYIVKLDESAAAGTNKTVVAKSAEEVVADDIVVVDDPSDALAFVDPEAVEYIEPNYKLTSFAFPDDDPRDWMYTDPSDYQWGIKYAGAKSAWLSGYNGTDVNIAIIDSGVVYGHEDLDQSKIIDSFNFTSGGANDKNAEDKFNHGSMVAGVIAAETDNVSPDSEQGIGMAGLTDKAGLLIYKVIDDNGDGDVADVLKAYDRILNSAVRVDVINLSLGHTGYSRTENDIIQKLNNKGIIIVAAAGNSGTYAGRARNEMSYPAGYSGVVGVGSIGSGGAVSSFSAKNISVDITAPGESISGLSHKYKSGTSAYSQGTGTSFAAPIVAAAAAMFKQHDVRFDSKSFLNALKNSATDSGAIGYDTSYGYGILSLSALIAYMDKAAQAVDTPPDGTPVNNPPAGAQPSANPAVNNPPASNPVTDPPVEETAAGGAVVQDEVVPVVEKKPVKRCKVTFAVNGGKRLAKSKRVKTVTIGKKYGKLPTPKRSGYKFRGWYTKRKGGARINQSTVMKSAGNTLTLYARWKKK